MAPLRGGTLAVGVGCTVRAWDHALAEETALLREHQQGAVSRVCLSRDGKTIFSGGREGTIRAADVASGLSRPPVLAPGSHVLSLALSGEGERLYSGGQDGCVREWNVATGVCTRVLRGHPGQVLGVCVVDDGDVFSCGQDGIRAWERAPSSRCKVLQGHTGGVLALCATRERLVSGGKDGTVHEWRLGECKRILRGHAGPVLSVCVHEDGAGARLFSGGQDGTIRVWQGPCVGGAATRVLQGHAGGVQSLCVSLSGNILFSGGLDGTVREWDVMTAKGKHLLACAGHVSAIAVSESGMWARVRTRNAETDRVPVDTIVPVVVGLPSELERFLAPDAVVTERRLVDARARQQRRLKAFVEGLHSVVDSEPSASLEARSSQLSEALFELGKEGGEVVDIGDLAAAVGAGGAHSGLISETLPVLSARKVCKVLALRVPPLLETLERQVQAAEQELEWQQSAMLAAREAERALLEKNESVLAAGEVAGALLESTRGLRGGFAMPGELEAAACVSSAKTARDAVEDPLAKARECQAAARKRHECATQELRRAEERGALFRDDTFPKISDEGQREVERAACGSLIDQLRQSVEWASSEAVRMDALVVFLEEVKQRCGGLLKDAEEGLRDGLSLEERAAELLEEREGVDAAARVVLEEGRLRADPQRCGKE